MDGNGLKKDQKGKCNSPRAPDNQRLIPIPLRPEANNIITALQPRHRTRLVQLLQSHLQRLPLHIHTSHEPDHLPLAHSAPPHLLHLRVELGQPIQKRLRAPHALQRGRDERLHGEAVRAPHPQPGQSGQDDQLPRHVDAVEVVAGIRLREARLFRLPDRVAPLAASGAVGGGEVVEEEAQGAGEDAFDAVDGVAGGDEVVQGGYDGQAGADGGFVIDETAAAVRVVGAVGGLVDGVPEVHAAGEGLLVGRHDADALRQEVGVSVGDILAAGVVNEDALVRQFVQEFESLIGCEGGRGGRFEVFLPCFEGEGGGAVRGAKAFGGAGDEDEGDVGKFMTEARELGEEVAANTTGSWGVSDHVERRVSLALKRSKHREI